jgi:hypothetical protein
MARGPKRKRTKRRNIPNIGYGKTVASGAVGGLTIIVVYVIEQLTGHRLPTEITAAVQTVLTTAAVYFTHHTLFERA